jgi:tetratricopeptide (TPR) repeat protein
VRLFSRIPLLLLTFALGAATLPAQRPSSSSSSNKPEEPAQEQQQPSSTVVRRSVEAGGSAVSLETSETLFTMAAALNSCGYDNGMESSLPVRSEIRQELATAVGAGFEARVAHDTLCSYIDAHKQPGARNLAQYVSLALFLSPPPDLALSVGEGDLPPDSQNVIGVLPLLRDFATRAKLHVIFLHHRAQYEAAVEQVHDSVTRMLLETNVYLHQPVSSYDGRRFEVLLEPMLSPQAVNARIYGTDYFIAVSPAKVDDPSVNRTSPGSRTTVSDRAAGLQMDQIRRMYLLYNVDPIIYARAGATNRLLPLLKTVSDAPVDFTYKSDIVALTTECLIKAIEARLMDVGFAKPAKPGAVKARTEIDTYNQALIDYEKRAEAVRRKQVLLDMESGWVLTGSFYDKLAIQDREGVSLKESIGEMVYGMDVPSEVSHAKKIPFFAPDSTNLVAGAGITHARSPRRSLSAMDQAELKLQKGDRTGAEELAEKELAANPTSGDALYILARIKLTQGDPQGAYDRFTQVLANSKDPRTVAWSHVYLGRLYDTQQGNSRPKAVAEYKAALSTAGIQQDVRAAAEAGIQKPFAAPKRTVKDSDQTPDDEELDPTGKKQKESYKPSEEITPPAPAK